MYVCMYVCMYVFKYVCMYVCSDVSLCTYVHAYVFRVYSYEGALLLYPGLPFQAGVQSV